MKPLLDISNKNSFTVWESCVWRETFSSSVLVAGPATEKLQVIYEKDPTRSSAHSLFYANVGGILAGCFINKPRENKGSKGASLVRVELMRIQSLSTRQVQGNSVPDAKLEPIHIASTSCVLEKPDFKKLIGAFEDRPSLPNARTIMEEAIKKAMTEPSQQKLFWGMPRVKEDQD